MSNPARAPAAKQRFRSFVKKVKMGKRMERALKEKAASSTSQENADDESKTPEPYSCTGVFEQDFTELCRRAGLILGEIPPVVIRPKRPPTPPPADPKAQTVTEDGEEEQKEPEEPPPTTYTIKPKFEYFKPTVQVEMEHEDKPATVTEIFIRGWKVDEIMMSVLKQCLPKIEKLQSLYLWNTSLTGKTLADLASVLRECSNLKNLTIDGNPVEEENFALLIADDSPVANICLRNNKITDKGAELIGKALSTPRTCNKNLVSLNLSYNKITDVGAVAIANGLRMNRVLLSLSLASNLIGDVGAKTLSETLSRFALSHEEVVERRKLIRDKGSPDRISGKSPPPSRRADNKDRPGSKGSGTLLDKSDKKRDKSSKKKFIMEDIQDEEEFPSREEEIVPLPKKSSSRYRVLKDKKGDKDRDKDELTAFGKGKTAMDATKGKEEDKTIKGGTKKEDKWKKETQRHGSKASVVAEVQGGKTAKGKKTVGGKDKKALLPEAETPDVVEAINPLMEQVENMDGKSWIPGNRALININLSRNKITEDGFESLLLAIQYQTTLAMMDPKPALKGLMRVSLNKNAVKPTNETAIKLQEIMVTKDPFYKPPSQSPDTDAQSHVGQ